MGDAARQGILDAYLAYCGEFDSPEAHAGVEDWLAMGGCDYDEGCKLLRGGIPPSQRPKVWLKMAHLHLERETAPEPIEACMEVPHHTETQPPNPGRPQPANPVWRMGCGNRPQPRL